MAKTLGMALIPFSLLVAIYVIFDPLLVLRWHEDMIPGGYLPNKGNVTAKQYEHFNPEMHYNSFIIGSSITINHWLDEWTTHLPDNAVPFHFDSSTMNVFQMNMVVDHLLENSDVKNILFVVPTYFFDWYDCASFPYMTAIEIQPSIIDRVKSHIRFFRNFYNQSFLSGALFEILEIKSGKDRHFTLERELTYYNPVYNEEVAAKKNIMLDSLNMNFNKENPDWEKSYDKLSNSFSHPKVQSYHTNILRDIVKKLEDNNVNYKFVVAPSRELPMPFLMNPADDAKLYEIFGDNYINLGSELNFYIANPNLWYDAIHYRNPVAVEIHKRIYER